MFAPGTTSRPPADMVCICFSSFYLISLLLRDVERTAESWLIRNSEQVMAPYNAQIAITTFANLPALPYLIFAVRKLLKDGDPSTLLMSLGGFLACGWEPVVDVLGNCFSPVEDQIVGFEFLGRPIPVFVPLTYLRFVGGMGYWCLSVLRDANTTRSDLWKLWVKYVAINGLLEYLPLYFGIYTYYGHQPFQVGGFPLWLPCVNASAPIVAATLTNFLSPHLKGWRSCGRICNVIRNLPCCICLSNVAVPEHGQGLLCHLPCWNHYLHSHHYGYLDHVPSAAGISIRSAQWQKHRSVREGQEDVMAILGSLDCVFECILSGYK